MEIKTIKGKVNFLTVPAFDHEISGRKCHRFKLSESESAYVDDLRKNNEWFYLSTITEKQAAEFVEYYQSERVYRNYIGLLDDAWDCKTAKESLVSLLKANDVWIKEWQEKPIKPEIGVQFEGETAWESYDNRMECYFKENELFEQLPDDLLLIKLKP